MDMSYETCHLTAIDSVYMCNDDGYMCENDRFYRDVSVIVIHCCIFQYFEIK